MKKAFTDQRFEYSFKKFDKADADPDPLHQFQIWLEEASKINPDYFNAMVLSTTGRKGKPSSRVVFLKGIENEYFVFYTNYLSRKGKELAINPFASLLFFWPEFERQIRIEGVVDKVSPDISNEYFVTRPRESRISALASSQSEIVSDRQALEKRFEEINRQFEGMEIPRPDHWGGFRLKPDYFEFWQGRASRLNDRIIYCKENNDWIIRRLFP